jgi:hypothetical protein
MFNTLTTNQIPLWPTPGVGPLGGTFGAMIGAPISQALAPSIAYRNDTALGRKVEAIRLPQASKQSDVRLRMTHIGECGWEWGIDNIAFYDIAPPGGATAGGTSIGLNFGANDNNASLGLASAAVAGVVP